MQRLTDTFEYHRGPGLNWKVERAGGLRPGTLAPGWLAIDPFEGYGAWFPTWEEALTFALEQALRHND